MLESGRFDATGSSHNVGAMTDSLTLECPHCGESFTIALDVSEGSAEFIVDCEVCCAPMTVAVRIKGGEIEGVDVAGA